MENELYHHGIMNMRWGVRRYQNKDGTLTRAGVKRYARDQQENAGKKKGDKVGAADPNRWVKEDMTRERAALNAGEQTARNLERLNRNTTSNKAPSRMNLSKMSDKEMRDQINREMLERQYTATFNSPQVNRGREFTSKALTVGGDILAVGASALSIALAIKELKG